MGNLLAELLIQISHQLHPIDRMECMLVCRHWKETIENSTLFHTVVILTESVLDRFLDKLEKHPHITDLVRDIVIHGIDMRKRVLSEVLPLFTKLRLLDFATESYCSYEDQIRYPCHDIIENLVDYEEDAPCAYIMLSSGICNNLSTLNTVTTKDNIIITLLKNAPNLKNLTLCDGSIDFNELNTLHANAPNLTTFNLNTVDVTGTGFQENINDPATSLVQFTFNDINIVYSELQSNTASRRKLLVYIAKKYPNLSWLDCSLYFEDADFNNEGKVMNIINNGWILLFTTMGSRLGRLSLRLRRYDSQFFEALDRSACQVHHLTITNCSPATFTKFPQSHQIHYIQTLVLEEVYVKTYEWLKEPKVLRELVLSSTTTSVQFSDILDSAPHTLKLLTLRGNYLVVDRNCSESSHIEALTLGYFHFPEQLDNFIARHFPALSNLKLEECYFKEKTFDLPNANLLVSQFTDFLRPKIFTVLIKSCSDNNSRMYLFSKDRSVRMGNHLSYGCPYKSYPASERNETPGLTFSFNSVKNILFTKE